MADKPAYMDIGEFADAGYLQELNRRFLHPLGLALEVGRDADGTHHLVGIWDCRSDPEGIYFDIADVDLPVARRRAQYVLDELLARKTAREKLFGGPIQPIGADDE